MQQVPFRGAIFSWIEFLSALVGLLVIISTAFGQVPGLPAPGALAVGWVCALATALLVLLIVQERRVRRRSSYAQALKYLHDAQHHIRDIEHLFLDDEATTNQVLAGLKQVMTAVANGFTLITGVPCRACIKQTHTEATEEDPQHWLRAIRVSTLARDTDTGVVKGDGAHHPVEANTDFKLLFLEHWERRWFMSNDIDRERPYSNSSDSYAYRSTCVWPIQKKDETGAPEIMGFLCVDSRETQVFHESFDFNYGASVADGLYSLLVRWAEHQAMTADPLPDSQRTAR